MRIPIAGCLMALLLCLTQAHAQQVYYHWVEDDEVWVWQTEADANTIELRLDSTGVVAEAPTDSLLRAHFAVLLQDDRGDVWNRLGALLRQAHQQEQHAAAQGRQAYRGFAVPRHPDVTIGVLDSLDRVYVDFRNRTLAHRLTFDRETQTAVLRAAPAGQSYDWLAPLFGQQRADSVSMERVARLFGAERALDPDDLAAWDSLFGAWLMTLPAPPQPMMIRTNAEVGEAWAWVSVAQRQALRPPEPSLPDTTGRDILAGVVVLVLLLLGIGVAVGLDRRRRPDAATPFIGHAPLPEDEETGGETTPDDALSIRQIRAGIDEHLDALEQAYGHYETLLPYMPQGDQAALQQTLELSQFLKTWYDEHVRAPGPARGQDSWHPTTTEPQKAWFERLVQRELPARDEELAARRRDIAALERQVIQAVAVINAARDSLDRLRRGESIDEEDTPTQTQYIDPRSAIPQLDDEVMGVGSAMKLNQDRIKDLDDLKPLVGHFQRGQRSFLDLHNDAQLDNALAGLIDYSLIQLALGLAAGARHDPRARAMFINLYTIARVLQVFNQKTVNGFDLAFEALKKDNVTRFKQDLPSSTERHGPEAKPFLVRLKYLRDVARVELKPFYYIDDQNRIKTIG